MNKDLTYEEGLKDGEALGVMNERVRIAQILYKLKVSNEIIMKATNFSLEEILDLCNNM